MRAVVIALVLAALAAVLPAESARVLRGEQGALDLDSSSSSRDRSFEPKPVSVDSEALRARACEHWIQAEAAVAVRFVEWWGNAICSSNDRRFPKVFERSVFHHDLHRVEAFGTNRCVGSIPWGAQHGDENPGDGSVHNCWKTHARWVNIAGGTDVTLTERITATEGVTESTARASATSLSVETGFSVGPPLLRASVSMSASHAITRTTTETIENTWGNEQGVQHSIPCKNGQVFQWITQISTPYLGGKDVTVATAQFACVPSNKVGPDGNPAEPMCPPRFCNDRTCQCCNSAKWAVDRSKGNVCPAPRWPRR